jgi:hypothetical protein
MEQASIDTTAPVPEPSPAPNPVDRPEWLPEKFESPEALAKAYGELETKLGGGTPPVESIPTKTSELTIEAASQDPPPATPPQMTPDLMAEYAQEFASSGALSESSRNTLNAAFGEQVVNQYMEGIAAKSELHVSKVLGAAGGQEEYGRMAKWAAAVLPKAEQDALNRVVDSMDTDAATAAVLGLKARYQQAMGMPPAATYGGVADPTGGIVPYGSTAELYADQAKPEYQKDPAFRAKVMQRLSVSEI